MHSTSLAIRRTLDAVITAYVSPELTGTRGMVLGFIARRTAEGQPVYQRDVEERFSIRRSSVTALLKAMEQDGFITRTGVKKDARLKSLALTAKGDAYIRRFNACLADFEQGLRKNIPQGQLQTLYTLLEHVRLNAETIRTALEAGTAPPPQAPIL